LQAQIDVQAKDVEIEHLRLKVEAIADVEIRRLQAEVQERALHERLAAQAKHAEIQRLRLLNQRDEGKAAQDKAAAGAGSACCLVS